jgi:ArsR family transcriptional regulator
MIDRNLKDEVIQLHAHVCSGLADTNRILLLYTLNESPRNVTELAELLNVPQPTVSRHLKILRERGMVSAHRDGQAVIYQVSDSRIIQALDLLRAVMTDNLRNQAALADNLEESQ